MTELTVTAARGIFIGYNTDGTPIAAAIYGAYGETRNTARAFASTGGLTPREFAYGDPAITKELTRLHNHSLSLAAAEMEPLQ